MRTYQGIALRTAYLIAGNAADAEEAAQDGFVKAYRALWRFRPGRAVQAVAAADRRQRGSQPPPLGRPARAARAARGRRGRPGDAAPSPEAALLGARAARGAGRRARAACGEPTARRSRAATSSTSPRPRRRRRSASARDRQVARSRARSSACATSWRRSVSTTERELSALAAYVDFPHERDLAPAVRARLAAAAPAAPRGSCSSPPRRCVAVRGRVRRAAGALRDPALLPPQGATIERVDKLPPT